MTNQRSPMSRQEAGRRGAEARWGRHYSDQDYNDQTDYDHEPRQHRATMSRQEAGQRGGRALAEQRGPEYFREIGRKGGEAVASEYGHEHYQDIGRRGGRALADQRGPDYFREIGKRGGDAVAAERGSDYYREIGRRGGETVAAERGHEYYQDIGRKGGRAPHQIRGRQASSQSTNATQWDDGSHENSRRHLYDQEDDEDLRLSRFSREWNEDADEDMKMSRQEAGRRGGQATASRYGREPYEDINQREHNRYNQGNRHYED